MFSLGLCCTFFVLKIMISTQISSGMVSGCWPKSRRPTLETGNPWFCSCEMQSENITNREKWFVGDFYDCLLWFDLVHFGIYWYSQVKYRRGSVWRVLQAEGVFGEKIAVDSKWNILINNKGFFYFHHPQQQRYTFRQERFKCRGRPCRWAPQSLLQGLHLLFFYWHKILVEMDVCIQETLENLKGSYEDDRVATMAVSIDIKKELETICKILKETIFVHSEESLVRRPRLGKNRFFG